MRTIHVELEQPLVENANLAGLLGAAVPKIRISTEVILSDDDEARDAGRDACQAITDFIAGYGEGGSS